MGLLPRVIVAFSFLASIAAAGLSTPAPLAAQPLAGRSRIEMRLGVRVETVSLSLSPSGVETRTEGRFETAFLYSRWFSESVAGLVGVGVLARHTEVITGTATVGTRTSLILPVFLGMRYYVPKSTYASRWRPFLSAAMGPVFGHQRDIEGFEVEGSAVGSVVWTRAVTRTAFGARLGGGLDVQLGRHVMLGVVADYKLMTDFSDKVGGKRNYGGPDFDLSISVLFGGGGGSADSGRGTG